MMILPTFGLLGSVPYHISFATRDVDEAMPAFTALFGVEWVPVASDMIPGLVTGAGEGADDWASRRVVSIGGPVHYELSEGSPGSIWHTEELATLHHLAYWTEDLPRTIDELLPQGWSVELTLLDDAGAQREFAYMSKPGWPRLELVDTSRRERFVETHAHQGAASDRTTW